MVVDLKECHVHDIHQIALPVFFRIPRKLKQLISKTMQGYVGRKTSQVDSVAIGPSTKVPHGSLLHDKSRQA
jgi:hypothetical protein